MQLCCSRSCFSREVASPLQPCRDVTCASLRTRQNLAPGTYQQSRPHHGHPSPVSRRNNLPAKHRALATANGPAGGDQVAIVIVDHGSRRKESNQQLDQFVDMYRNSHPGRLAFAAHMEIAEPSIMDAVRESVKAGCRKVIVAPYFLSYGRHIQQDIPALVAEAQAAFPDVQCVIADPIGLDEAVVGVINSRVDSALARSAGAAQ